MNQILGGVAMTSAAQNVKRGLLNVLPEGFLNITRRVVGNSVKWNSIEGSRELARLAQYGAPAQLVGKKGITQAQATLAHVFEQMTHDPLVLQNMQRADAAELQDLAVDEIDRQTADFMERCNSLRVAMAYSLLANGKLWFDAAGQLLFSAVGAAQTVDFGVPAANRNQLAGIVDAGWDNTATDIIGQVAAIRKAALRTSGYPLLHAFYGENIAGYIAGNEAVRDFLGASPALAREIHATGEIPDGFLGLKWHPAYNASAPDATGTMTDFFSPDAVVFAPEPSPDWYEFVEGSYMVPRRIDVSGDAIAAAGNLATVFGRFSYAIPTHNPVSIQHFAGDTAMPLLKVPGAIFQAVVKL